MKYWNAATHRDRSKFGKLERMSVNILHVFVKLLEFCV